MKFNVKKLETVATTVASFDTPNPWKETKVHCL